MGKATKWFRGLLGLKKPESSSPTSGSSSAPKPPKEKRRWRFVKSYREKDNHHANTAKPVHHHHTSEVAVQSPGHVVIRLTSSGTTAETAANVAGGIGIREEWAAIKIQAAFRGCLARRALRALKGLVKLQALARGHIERKRTAEWLQRMQALLRAQAQVCAGRAQILQTSYSGGKSSTCHLHFSKGLHLQGPATPDKFESPIRSKSMNYEKSSVLKRNGSKPCVQINGNREKCGNNRPDSLVDEQSRNQGRSSIRTPITDDEKSVRILEIDSGKPHVTTKRRNLFYPTSHALLSDRYSQGLTTSKDSTSFQSGQSPSCEVQSYGPIKINELEETPFCTADNSPQFLSASSKDDGSRRSSFTPTRSDGSRSYLTGYSDYPSYMAYTESSKAKVRSLSAPKQRPQYERSSSSNRYSLHGFGESRLATQRASALHASFTSKAYPGSGRLDKLGMPVGYRY